MHSVDSLGKVERANVPLELSDFAFLWVIIASKGWMVKFYPGQTYHVRRTTEKQFSAFSFIYGGLYMYNVDISERRAHSERFFKKKNRPNVHVLCTYVSCKNQLL